jgi:hypothetical protein
MGFEERLELVERARHYFPVSENPFKVKVWSLISFLKDEAHVRSRRRSRKNEQRKECGKAHEFFSHSLELLQFLTYIAVCRSPEGGPPM